MANANPCQWHGKPANWYRPQLKPVSTKQPRNPTRIDHRACQCGQSIVLTDVDPEVKCPECGTTIKL